MGRGEYHTCWGVRMCKFEATYLKLKVCNKVGPILSHGKRTSSWPPSSSA